MTTPSDHDLLETWLETNPLTRQPYVHVERYRWVALTRLVFKNNRVNGHNELAMLIVEFVYRFFPYAWIKTLKVKSFDEKMWTIAHHVPCPRYLYDWGGSICWYADECGKPHLIVSYGYYETRDAWIDYTDNTIMFISRYFHQSFGRRCIAHKIVHSPRVFLNLLPGAIEWYQLVMSHRST